MARIVLADDGIQFDGTTPGQKPLGGVESSVVNLCETLAARGHEVLVRNKCAAPILHNGVDWAPIAQGLPETADLYIANRGDKLIPLLPRAKRRLFWIHNPAQYLLKWRYLHKLWKWRPVIVFIGSYHATTCPEWVPDGGRKVIPYGTPDEFRLAAPGAGTPPPRAVFTSNPLRSLDWILERWESDIRPAVPDAELHVFAGAATYGSVGDAKAEAMNRVLAQAEALADRGVVLRGPVPKSQLVEEFRAARCMLYRGDLNETYCLAVGEAQAMGVPAVVEDLGSMAERVRHGTTGAVVCNAADFSAAAIDLLSNVEHWQTQHDAALALQRSWGWVQAAEAFEEFLP
ncbi:hypothetical protein JCM17960_25100 [Magnetospira thiophila]